jgi:hypothetical protein
MRPAFGPVEAGSAEHLAAARVDEVDADAAQQRCAAGGQGTAVLAEHDVVGVDQGVGDGDAERSGEVVVAGTAEAQRIVTRRPRAIARRRIDRGDAHDALQHVADAR